MLKVLLKKQLSEVFRNYFYDAKKNKMRSKWAVVAWFAFFILIMAGVLGGMFTVLSMSLCGPLTQVGVGWLYFLLMGGIAIVLGAFGSVFNTYSGLYLARDNDLLLSLPIPVRTVMASRLLNVYLLGAVYSAVALLPALAVYWVVCGVTAARIICGVVLLVVVTVLVLLLSCLLGWGVAKLSLRLRHKSLVTVLASLAFIGAYYFFYFKASALLQDLLGNAALYGQRIKGVAYGLYLFGRIGEGDWLAAGVFVAATALLSALIWYVMSRSFLRVVTSTGSVEKARYVERPAQQKTPFRALLGKEFARFTASANYMLNCGLGVLLIPASGVLLLIVGRRIFGVLGQVFAARPNTPAVLLCAALCLLSSMNEMAVPAVSLEGKSLWLPQSLPVSPKTVLRAKMSVQLILTEIPMLFAAACGAWVIEGPLAVKLLVVVMPMVYVACATVFGAAIGVRMPLLQWTHEIYPIKQSGAIVIAMFGSWGLCAAVAGLYLLVGYRIGAALYLTVWTVVLAAAALLLLRWLDTRGAETFAAL